MTAKDLLTKLEKEYPQSIINVHSEDDVHFEVYIESSSFKGLTRVEQHQQVMKVFSEELKTGELHALALKTKEKK